MTTQTEALKLALEALESSRIFVTSREKIKHPEGTDWYDERITAIKEALAQPEQEPVALRHSFDGYGYLYTDLGFGSGWIEWTKRSHKDVEPLYTTPPQRKPLTDEMVVAAARMLNERQADACGVDRDDQWAIYSDGFKADARAMLEAAHGIKE